MEVLTRHSAITERFSPTSTHAENNDILINTLKCYFARSKKFLLIAENYKIRTAIELYTEVSVV